MKEKKDDNLEFFFSTRENFYFRNCRTHIPIPNKKNIDRYGAQVCKYNIKISEDSQMRCNYTI